MSDEPVAAGLRLPLLVLVAGFLVAGVFTRTPQSLPWSLAGIAIAIPAAAFVDGRRSWLTLVQLAIAAAGVLLVVGPGHSSPAWFGICALCCLGMIALEWQVGVAFVTVMVALIVFKMLAQGFDSAWLPWVGGVAVSALGGAVLRHDRLVVRELRAAQESLAERSRTEERTRIARDLHDVIAHSLTVSLLHVSAARLAVTHDGREQAAEALIEAERLGRQSLDEVRSIVGLMRDPAMSEDALTPTPDIDGVAVLVARFRTAGVEVQLEQAGPLERLPATLAATAYRIVQESLTNAAKHAPGAPVTVAIHAGEQALELTVESRGPAGTGTGNGLVSMRERAQAVGGSLQAGPAQLGAGGGWRVTARLPVLAPTRNGT